MIHYIPVSSLYTRPYFKLLDFPQKGHDVHRNFNFLCNEEGEGELFNVGIIFLQDFY